jgi:hypothetical protein
MNNARLSEISDEVLDVGRAYFVQWSVAEMVQKRLQAIVNRVRQVSLFAMAWRSLYTLANSRNDNGPVVACKECSSNVPSRIAARSSSRAASAAALLRISRPVHFARLTRRPRKLPHQPWSQQSRAPVQRIQLCQEVTQLP